MTMALWVLGALGVLVSVIVIPLIVNLLSDEIQGWAPRWAAGILRIAARRLAPSVRERYIAEWLADLEALPQTAFTMCWFALRTATNSGEVAAVVGSWWSRRESSTAPASATTSTTATASAPFKPFNARALRPEDVVEIEVSDRAVATDSVDAVITFNDGSYAALQVKSWRNPKGGGVGC